MIPPWKWQLQTWLAVGGTICLYIGLVMLFGRGAGWVLTGVLLLLGSFLLHESDQK
jgi:4-amino-4-deoxy-L-arabinose transferase-like glycosyltransferase